MKPYLHAESSAKKYKGVPTDYLKIHDWFDQTKAHFPTNAHRAILHSSFGIFLCEQVFGHVITNSDKIKVSVRDLGEQHLIEDLGFIPTVADYLNCLNYQPWMHGGDKPAPKIPVPFVENIENIVYDGSMLPRNRRPSPQMID